MFNISSDSKIHLVVIFVVIIMGYLYINKRLTNELAFIFSGIVVFFMVLDMSDKKIITLEIAMDKTDIKANEFMNQGLLEGQGTLRIIPEAESKQLFGLDLDQTPNPYKHSVIVSLSGSGYPTKHYLFEWSIFGDFLGITRLSDKMSIKKTEPSLTVFRSKLESKSPKLQESEEDESDYIY